jgi:hypothetical protein
MVIVEAASATTNARVVRTDCIQTPDSEHGMDSENTAYRRYGKV